MHRIGRRSRFGGAINGSFEDSHVLHVVASNQFQPVVEVAPEKVEPLHITIEEVVVMAAPRKPVKIITRGPVTCKTRDLKLYGGKVRVCARPASPNTRSAADLAAKTR